MQNIGARVERDGAQMTLIARLGERMEEGEELRWEGARLTRKVER